VRGTDKEMNIILELNGGPVWTVPELVFEKKGLIPALQRLLVQADDT
jgi:hypothetical protein